MQAIMRRTAQGITGTSRASPCRSRFHGKRASRCPRLPGAGVANQEEPTVNQQKAEQKVAPKAEEVEEKVEEEEKSDEYTETMQQRMGTTLTYRHEDGINWNDILDYLIVGSCLQTPEDVDKVAEAGVATVFCLQEDSDLAYFNMDIDAIAARCAERGDVKHVRFRIRDFDPFDLRLKLPKAVARLAKEHDPARGKVYIHCTAGLGRAPAVALAYMTWLRGWQLDEAFALLRSKRMCSPRLEAVRAATADLLLGAAPLPVKLTRSRRGVANKVQVAGLDMGWHAPVDMSVDPKTQRYTVQRLLMPGRYPFKFIVDGVWACSADYPTVGDGNNTNNFLEVLMPLDDPRLQEQQRRLLSSDGLITPAEREELQAILCPWSSHDAIFHQLKLKGTNLVSA